VKKLIPILMVLMLASFGLEADDKEPPKPAQSIPELQQQLEKILKETHTPGMSVAIVHREGPEWVAALGLMDVAANRPATPQTLFRIGSTSKAFASLSILLLADQGKLSLDEPVHKLAPEVWYDNKWESTDPIRVVNLLEHTTGWDDMHLREYAKDAPDIGLREALDYDHHSRISRWPPNTRMAYCNSGPAVAAFIVEQITGQRFEDFVQQNLFAPIGMKTATYFKPTNGNATTLYHEDGKTPYPYWNIIYRPAGAINASAEDMARYVQFYLNRGSVNGAQVVPSADIDRMEIPKSTWAAQQGLKDGYGLSNYWSIEDGFVYHGHDGGVNGGLTNMAYMPDYDVGYFFSINSGNGAAFGKIQKTICAYITRRLDKPPVPAMAPLPSDAENYAGWYEPDSERNGFSTFLERLTDISLVKIKDGQLLVSNLGGRNERYIPVAGEQFRHLPIKDAADPVATMELLAPNSEGVFIQADTQTTLKKIPGWFALLEIALTAYVILSVVAIVLYAPFWILGGISKRRRKPAERGMRIWPLIAVLSMFAVIAIVIACSGDLISLLGNRTIWSVAFCVATIVFALASIESVWAVWRTPRTLVRPGVRRFSLAVAVALMIATIYFAYWGVIGMRTWV
jgi:CubicO group peptidase (beta-lactamase class C family)